LNYVAREAKLLFGEKAAKEKTWFFFYAQLSSFLMGLYNMV
jgi:hypothetical protein